MRKQTILTGAAVLVLTVFLSACDGLSLESAPSSALSAPPADSSAPASTTPVTENAPALEAPQWGEQVFTQTYEAGDGTQVMEVRYTLPLIQNTDDFPAGAVINEWYKTDGAGRMESAEENYEQVVADYDVSQAAGFSFSPVTEEMDYEVLLSTDQVISIRRTWYINSGAAYPTVFQLGENFDPQTGIKLTFTDIFTDAQTVEERVVDAFMAKADLAAGGFTREDLTAAYQQEQFCLTPDGYTFWIQGNTLSAVHSPVEVTLSYDTLKDVSMYAAQ